MSLVLFFAVIASIILLAIAFYFMPDMFKSVLAIAFFIILLVGGFWLGMDIYELRNHFYQDKKLFALDIEGKIAGAFVLGSDLVPEPVDDLESIRSQQSNNRYYKTFVVSWPFVARSLEIEGTSMSAEEIRAVLLSPRPKEVFVAKAVEKNSAQARQQILAQSNELYHNDDVFASTIFVMLSEESLNHPTLFLQGIREDLVRVAPETAMFKILRFLPTGISRLLIPPAKEDA